jgi:hypothetical protein
MQAVGPQHEIDLGAIVATQLEWPKWVNHVFDSGCEEYFILG